MKKIKCKDSKFIFDRGLFFSLRKNLELYIISDKCSHEFNGKKDNQSLNGLAEQLAVIFKHMLEHERRERISTGGDRLYTIGDRVVRQFSDEDDSITEEIEALPSIHKGYHVDAGMLISLKRNKFADIFPGGELFIRAKDSTYKTAVDNYGKERPGFSHWYSPSRFCSEMFNMAKADILALINRDKNYSTNDVRNQFKSASESNLADFLMEDLFTVPLTEFKQYSERFLSGKEPSFANALFNLVHMKDSVCYINNNLGKEERLHGYCREHTILSGLKKTIRIRMFEGYYEYDISTAVQAIQVNLYNDFKYRNAARVDEIAKQIIRDHITKENEKDKKAKLKGKKYRKIYTSLKELTSLSKTKRLIRHKDGARRDLSKLITGSNYNVVEAKQAFTEMTFGSKRGNFSKMSSRYGHNGKTGFALHNYITRFELEALLLREVCLESKYTGDRKVAIDKDIKECNDKRKFKGQGKHIKDQIMYRIYEIEESKIRAVMKQCLSTNYQIHDCVISKMDVNIRELTKYVLEKTGHDLQFSKEKYLDGAALRTAHEKL